MDQPNTGSDRPADLSGIQAVLERCVQFEEKQIQLTQEELDLSKQRTLNSSNLIPLLSSTSMNTERQTGMAQERTSLTREQTRLSTRSTELANIRTDLGRERTQMAEQRTDLAVQRSELARRRTSLAEGRTKLAQTRTADSPRGDSREPCRAA